MIDATPLIVCGCLFVALFIGRSLNRFVPHDHLSPEARDSMKLAVGWVATMSALILGLLAPKNVTAITTLVVSAFSISGAIFLIVELDRPLGGLIRIPSDPLMNALNQLAR